MKLYGTYLSPFTRRVAAALISREVAFEHDPLNGYEAPDRALALSPIGKVPVLVLPDGERLWDSSAILDYLNERFGPDKGLVPASGPARRKVLGVAAIATTLYERATVAFFESGKPPESINTDLLAKVNKQVRSGLSGLDQAASTMLRQDAQSPDLATISAVVAFDYVTLGMPSIEVSAVAPQLAELAAKYSGAPAFSTTTPGEGV